MKKASAAAGWLKFCCLRCALFANSRVGHLLREFPQPALFAFLLPQSGPVLHLGPFVPSKVSGWRWIAGFERWLHANDAARDLYACHSAIHHTSRWRSQMSKIGRRFRASRLQLPRQCQQILRGASD
jgi:hypothetical protein